MNAIDIFFIFNGIIYIVTSAIIIFFALITLITIIYYWNSQCRSISNLLTCNSSIAFLVLNVSVVIQIPQVFRNDQYENNGIFDVLCRLKALIFLFGCLIKIFSYLIQAISRYFIIVLYRRRKLLSFQTNIILIIFCWTVSLLIAGFTWLSPVAFQYESESRLCLLTTKVFSTSFTLMTIAFLIPVQIIIVLYMNIICFTTRTNFVQPTSVKKRSNKRNMKVFQNILILVVILVLGGTPYFLSMILNLFIVLPWSWYPISIIFMMLSTTIDSCFLFLTNKEVKNIIFRKLRCPLKTERERLIRIQTMLPITIEKRPEHFRMTPIIKAQH